MLLPLSVFAVLVFDLVLTCVLLRWLPVRRERWIPMVALPAVAALALVLGFGVRAPWQSVFAACAGFLCGTVLALLPFRGWVSSWTLPVRGEARLRWSEVVLVLVGSLTPLSTKRTNAAQRKAFTVREVVRERGRFPHLLGAALFVLPALCAVGAGWAAG
ncbi:hypothetical protein KVH22_15925 [Streptomyces olivaceus]|uniref:hypothetical protein n=1 Tax=Streptomyces olivaceus TaxID=47716 RepID=UPI0004C4E91C|nr:hypothetical protein [Streptomyces olivaceus]MBF8174998.1 hypothetical protein [Streptomyces olivaceus]MBZ6101168.1 hypothetical protein [Streptomyces olivaceus]MBZ6257022.1 hypothetical protein [Streptomyces olivaceus]